MSDQATIPTMQVKVYAPFKVYFDGPATSVSAKNRTGNFDVLAHHKNFMTLLIPCNIVVRALGKPDYVLPIARGVMHVKADKTTVFLDV
ncbi:MAG TPA: hypothetical protein VMT23_00845 [Candidatus Binatia bacterium]|nr:hypothetical protein [Candidatus Binatia bacterium]